MSARDTSPEPLPKVTVATLAEMRQRGEPITALTAYDYPSARLVDAAGIDVVLVGDSLAMVVLGHPTTLAVTMEEMLHHARAVSRGASRALLVGDLPFLTYQTGTTRAVRNAGRFLQEGGMAAVKLEGGRAYAKTVQAIVRAGIPVQGHIGLMPQSVNALGGFKVQGRTAAAAGRLLDDALSLEDAGCFSLVLESIPDRVAAAITERLTIPTIGIGAGASTDGQVLVIHDLLGLFHGRPAKFVKGYAELAPVVARALALYRQEVKARAFPAAEHAYSMPEGEWSAFLEFVHARARQRIPNQG